MPLDHARLAAVMIRRPEDYAPYGKATRDHPDCSSGCRWFHKLDGEVGYDWGVCGNPRSHRVGLLTYEHQGCVQFEGDGP